MYHAGTLQRFEMKSWQHKAAAWAMEACKVLPLVHVYEQLHYLNKVCRSFSDQGHDGAVVFRQADS